jgi:hypothetical protein
MDNNTVEKQLPEPHDMQLSTPHDMLLRKPNFAEAHPWIHWVPALVGLLVGLFVGGVFLNEASIEQKQTSNPVTIISPTQMPSPTTSFTTTISPINTPADSTSSNNNEVFCTQDAKQCPDGSWVGRIGPKCEFASCAQP